MKKQRFENDLEVSDFVPWHDPTKWIPGRYYPLPHSDHANFDNVTLEVFGVSWGVYFLDPLIDRESALYGDILVVVCGLNMKDACMAANSLNEVREQ